MPLIYIEVGKVAIDMQRTTFRAFHLDIDSFELIVGHREIERRNTHRNGDIHVIRIYVRQLVLLCYVCRRGMATHQDGDEQKQ